LWNFSIFFIKGYVSLQALEPLTDSTTVTDMLVQELTLSMKETLPQPTSSDELYSFFAITPLSASSISEE
jgi:hypothetical protein